MLQETQAKYFSSKEIIKKLYRGHDDRLDDGGEPEEGFVLRNDKTRRQATASRTLGTPLKSRYPISALVRSVRRQP